MVEDPTGAAARIVVGVDDSEGARLALRWAADEAQRRGARLQAVNVWSPPWTIGFDARWAEDRRWFADQARAVAEKLVAELDGPPVDLSCVELEADGPAFGLLDVAAGADLLVVGTRGRGGFAGLLLGSVAAQCTRHAPCPVVVVPPAGEAPSREVVEGGTTP